MYEKTFVAGWGDMDFNSHMCNTAYLDKSADVRMMYFSEHGFPMAEFMRLRIGPVIMKDEVEYFKEVQLLAALRVTLSQAGQAEDGSRFLLRNEIYRGDGKLVARVTSAGGWLDLSSRRLVVPPEALWKACNRCQKQTIFKYLRRALSN
jgi:acyl-CoA thioester hydrolase